MFGSRLPPALQAEPAFNAPIRYALIVLSWLAFGVTGYLALHSVGGTSVAGCGVGTSNGCDVVLASSWSKWLGIPVAVLGLACYAALASLSVLLGLRNERLNKPLTTAFVMLAIMSAGASLWFIGVQVFAIGSYCKFCLVADLCGILIGIIAVVAAVRSTRTGRSGGTQRGPATGLMGIGPAPTSLPQAAKPIGRAPVSAPSLVTAFGIAVPLLVVLIGGQFLFASKTFQVEKLALSESFKMDESVVQSPSGEESTTATTRVAMRVPSETESAGAAEEKADPAPDTLAKSDTTDRTELSNAADAAKAETAPEQPLENAEPAKQRLVKFLGGKLTLDTYKHPLIGSPEAPHVVVEMVSYDCPHCRQMYPIFEQALERYGDQVAMLVMPIPLDKGCNRLITDDASTHRGACGTARTALGVARVAPKRFARFHDFLMTGKDKPPAIERIVPKAYGMVGSTKLIPVTRGAEVKKQIESYVDLYAQLQSQSTGNKNFGLPVQILGDQVMTGSVEKPEDVFKAWEEHLGVKPK